MHKSVVYLGLISAVIAFVIYHSANADQQHVRHSFSAISKL